MIAFLFPGQGSQKPGMGKPWVDTWPALFDLASTVAGKDVRRLVCDADADELRATDNAQLATAVCSLAAHRCLTEAGLQPTVVAGHSLGEYTALVATEAVELEDGLRLIAARGEGMAVAATRHPGTMTALLGADVELAERACSAAGGTVVVANVNAEDQVVVSGSADAVERAVGTARELGAKRALPLDVGGAFHSPLMAPALPMLAAALARTELRDPAVPIICNVDARPKRTGVSLVPSLLAQLCSPVLWRDTTDTLVAGGLRGFVEVGMGRVLTRLAKRAVPGAVAVSVAAPEDAIEAASALAGVPTGRRVMPSGDFGEVVDMADRLVVAPVRGRFKPAPPGAYTSEGEYVREGQIVGEVLTSEGPVIVHSAFSGWVMNQVAGHDDRVETGQPLLSVRPF